MCDLADSFRLANELVSSVVKKMTISFKCCKKKSFLLPVLSISLRQAYMHAK